MLSLYELVLYFKAICIFVLLSLSVLQNVVENGGFGGGQAVYSYLIYDEMRKLGIEIDIQ